MSEEKKQDAIVDVIVRYKRGQLSLANGSAELAFLTDVPCFLTKALLKSMSRENVFKLCDFGKKDTFSQT